MSRRPILPAVALMLTVSACGGSGTPVAAWEQQEGDAPSWVPDSKPAAETLFEEGGEWPGPAGFQQKFEELWGVK